MARRLLEEDAVKAGIVYQLLVAMAAQGVSQSELARRMGTSRAQVARLLDPGDGNVTLVTLQRAAAALGGTVHVQVDQLPQTRP
jgi:transcriptional regulator with XRE-family HTH domain